MNFVNPGTTPITEQNWGRLNSRTVPDVVGIFAAVSALPQIRWHYSDPPEWHVVNFITAKKGFILIAAKGGFVLVSGAVGTPI